MCIRSHSVYIKLHLIVCAHSHTHTPTQTLAQTNHDRTESCSSSQTSPIRKNYPTLMLTAPVFDLVAAPANTSPSSPLGQLPFFGHRTTDDDRSPSAIPPPSAAIISAAKASRASARKSKMQLDIACLPEGVPLDITTMPVAQRSGKPPPSPLSLGSRQVRILWFFFGGIK